jgi:hypothetical protein
MRIEALQEELPRMGRSTALLWGIVFVAVWFVVDGLLVPPALGGTDFYYFKDAAINLASGLGFVSRFTFGNPTFDDRVFAIYPPLYTLLFASFVKLAGVSAVTNQAFNAVVGIVLGLAGFLAVKPLLDRATGRYVPIFSAILFATAIAANFFLPGPDRPDGLGVSIGLFALVVLGRPSLPYRELVAGMLSGATLLVSPFAGIWTLAAIGVVVFERYGMWSGIYRVIGRGFLVLIGVAGVLAVSLAAFATFLPGWFPAFVGVLTGATTGNETGGGYFLALLRGDLRTWLSAFPLGDPNYFVDLSKLVIVAILLAGALTVNCFRFGAKKSDWAILLLLGMSLLCVLTSPYQPNYLAMTSALLLGAAACVSIGAPLAARRAYTAAILGAFALICLMSVPQRAREIVIRVASYGSMKRALAEIDSVRQKLVSPDQLIAVSPGNYILWREKGLRPLTTTYSGLADPRNREHLLYVAITYGGTGNPLQGQIPPWLTEREYKLVLQPKLPQYASIFGVHVSRSSHTWESGIYIRTDR